MSFKLTVKENYNIVELMFEELTDATASAEYIMQHRASDDFKVCIEPVSEYEEDENE